MHVIPPSLDIGSRLEGCDEKQRIRRKGMGTVFLGGACSERWSAVKGRPIVSTPPDSPPPCPVRA